MKPKLLTTMLCASMLFLSSCDPASTPHEEAKTVADKIIATEQRMSVDWMDAQVMRSRAESVYYLVAEDGSLAEVPLTTYVKTKIGEDFSAFWTE